MGIAGKLKIVTLPVERLRPYERNARRHEAADVGAIAESIRQFGFNDPIGVWGPDNLIVEGHGRLLAAKELGMTEVPCVRLDHLSEEERRAYALAHNRTAELSEWDPQLLDLEIGAAPEIDFEALGFEVEIQAPRAADWFSREEKDGDAFEEGNEEYNEFVDKFKPKKTTDDCYTPELVYEAIAAWVADEFKLDRSKFVRPFYPGGDYQAEEYPPGCVVVDNPPFSILREICLWYLEHGVKFFLFAPTLTLFSSLDERLCYITGGGGITYENGADVNTSFITNLDEEYQVRTAPALAAAIDKANRENVAMNAPIMLKYSYPSCVITAAKVSNWGAAGIEYKVPKGTCSPIRALDEQREKDKAIFGGGFLLSTKQAAQAAQAARAAQAAQAAQAARKIGINAEKIAPDGSIIWQLSERELAIVKEMDEHEQQTDIA